MRELNGPEAVEAAAGEELGTSAWMTIEQDTINAFAETTGDRQWIHIDPERAAEGTYGSTIAHGFLTLSLIPRFSSEIFAISGVSMRVNYGLNKVRFPQAVPVGSRLRDTASLKEVTRGPKGTQVVISHVIEVDGFERPACIAEMVLLLAE